MENLVTGYVFPRKSRKTNDVVGGAAGVGKATEQKGYFNQPYTFWVSLNV